jgi:hypothetical protein
MSRSAGGRSDEFEVNPKEVRFGIFHAKYAKGGKEELRDEGVKGLRKRCGLSDRGVRFGIFHAPQLRDALSRAKDEEGFRFRTQNCGRVIDPALPFLNCRQRGMSDCPRFAFLIFKGPVAGFGFA